LEQDGEVNKLRINRKPNAFEAPAPRKNTMDFTVRIVYRSLLTEA